MIVLDTGVLLAAADVDDRYHEQATTFLRDSDPAELIMPAAVATVT